MWERILIIITLVLVGVGGVTIYREHRACKQRGQAYDDLLNKIERAAESRILLGTPKDAVIRFFADYNIPWGFDPRTGEAEGEIYMMGCGPYIACGDSAFIVVKVKMDDAGRVTSKEVGGLYNNCL